MVTSNAGLLLDRDSRANSKKGLAFFLTPINKIHKVVPKRFNLQVTCYVSKNGHGERYPSDKRKLVAMYSRSPQNLECGHFTLLVCRGRQRNVPQ